MNLAAGVKRYLEVAGGFDRPLHLSQLGLDKAETEKLVSAWDEDYQISRYMLLSREREEELAAFPAGQRVYLINGFECTHLIFHPDIQTLLWGERKKARQFNTEGTEKSSRRTRRLLSVRCASSLWSLC
jgi:hypothetical protein